MRTKTKPARGWTRVHFSLSPGAMQDMDLIAKLLGSTRDRGRSGIVCAAIRCFHESLAAGLAAESGELLGRPAPKRPT